MDKRIARRSFTAAQVQLKDTVGFCFQGEILDISESGLLVQGDSHLDLSSWPVGTALQVSCVLPTGALAAKAEITRVNLKAGQVGLRWTHFQSPGARANLLAFVANGFL